jgi:hypothetical protein
VENGVWTDYEKGKNNWNAVKAVFPDKEPRYRVFLPDPSKMYIKE